MALDEDRRAALHEARARRLIGVDESTSGSAFPGAVAFDQDGQATALLHEAGPKPLGGVLVWAWRHRVASLRLFVDESADPGALARRAGAVDAVVSVDVVSADGAVAPVEPEALPEPVLAPVDASLLAEFAAHGVDVVADHDGFRLELSGLEVGRLESTDDTDRPAFSVGVGAIDREATRVLHRHADSWDNLGRVVAEVRRHRRAGGGGHPLSLMARARWMRRWLSDEPHRMGLDRLTPVLDPLPFPGMRVDGPAAGIGVDHTDTRRLVVASVGGDVGMLSTVADLVVREAPDSVLIVTPAGASVAAITDAVAMLRVPTESVEIDPPWR